MAYSRKYNNYKYIYTADNSDEFIRSYREYKSVITQEPLIPVTNAFLETTISSREKVVKFEDEVRRLEVLFPTEIPDATEPIARFKLPLPHPPISTKLNTHIEEIRNAVADKFSIVCTHYFGENRSTEGFRL